MRDFRFRLLARVDSATSSRLAPARRAQWEQLQRWKSGGTYVVWDVVEGERVRFQCWCDDDGNGALFVDGTTRLDLVRLHRGRIEPRISDPSPATDALADALDAAFQRDAKRT